MKAASGAPRILLVEDQHLLRSLMRRLLEVDGRYRVVGEAADREQTLALAASVDPELILLDLYLGEDSAVDFLPQLRVVAPAARILLVTGSDDVNLLQRAIQAGARGIVIKDASIETLLKAVDKVHAGEMWLDRMFTAGMIEGITGGQNRAPRDPNRARIDTLTQREKEVTELVCRGMNNRAIAEKLSIAEITIRHHLTSVFAKLGVPDRVSLVVYCHRFGRDPQSN